MAAEIIAFGSSVDAMFSAYYETGTYGCLLLTAIGTVDHSDATVADVLAATNVEATTSTVASYARITGLSSTATVSRSGSKVIWKPPNVTFPSLGTAGQTIVGAILYRDGASDDAREVLATIDMNGSVSLDGTNYIIRFPEASGAIQSRIIES